MFVNILYMPAKLVYATLGGFTGGVAYLLTGANMEVANRIWTPSLGGNCVVTPAHLRNEQTLFFSGTTEPPQAEAAPQTVAAPQKCKRPQAAPTAASTAVVEITRRRAIEPRIQTARRSPS